ncbi:LysR family transcriptional regulator [Bibersteinia trehalosi USDA-ARS-USMARC-190]|uniref:LysR family transcriptional regulator n=1 Tax=Bibersteinia trehalosi USDA-ARS-USMARC-190 TaxID=1263832 RepID=W0R2H5_BIBTR|nr:LysR family transcriptional regulator [Bibersteinia trehalosi]AHG85324.1 LysR family transcriptional regulator [Bibersteinia trehalosi USDA-ARS-USMARC-190]
MDRIQAINIFLTIAETGSFTATAERLDLSKPMVSRAVVLLEEWFNARLLQRTTRKVSLTEAGEQAIEYCRKMANLTEEMEQNLLARSGELSGTLRIAAEPMFGSTELLQILQQFMAQHPKLHIQLHLSDKAVDLVEERIDLAIRFTNTPDPSLIARHLGECHSLLVASPDYLAQGEPHSPCELNQFRFLSHTNINRKAWRFYQAHQETIIELPSPFITNDTHALLNAVLAGNGIAMLPKYLLNQHLAEQRLKVVLSEWTLPVYQLYALYPSRHRLPLSVRAFLDFLVESIQGKNW